MTVRMTLQDAIDWVEDQDVVDDVTLAAVFRAVYGRAPEAGDRESLLFQVKRDSKPSEKETYYDYAHQAWIVDGLVAPCNHPEAMRPGCCYAGAHAGTKAMAD